MEEERLLQFFRREGVGGLHPAELEETAGPFARLARVMIGWLAPGPERTVCLRKLLEAQDAAIRAKLDHGGQ